MTDPTTTAATCGHRPAPFGPQAAHNVCTLEPGHRGGHYDAVCRTDWPNDLWAAGGAPAFDATATNLLAAELRGILDDLHDAEHGDAPKYLVRSRLERLAEHVERVGAGPDAIELTGSFGLDPEQEIRARALAVAVDICDRATMPDDFVVADYEVLVVGAADRLAAYIRDGARP
jgi:hypothetical protein